MSDYEAFLATIVCIGGFLFILRILPLLVFLPQITVILFAIQDDLSFMDEIQIAWTISGDLDFLEELLDEYNKDGVIFYYTDDIYYDDEDDDDDFGTPLPNYAELSASKSS